jgi:hypothetical protein
MSNGPNLNFDSADRSPSYKNHPSDWTYKLTSMDMLAMVELQGLENDPSGLSQSGDASDEQFTVVINGAASDEFGNVLRIDAGAGDGTFITDLRGTLAGQSGTILRGDIGSDLSRFLLPDPDSNNPLLWLDLYRSAALSLSIVQATRSDGAYTITITDSEQLEFKFTGNGTAQTLSFNGGTSYGRTGYGELISRAIPITAAIIPVVPAPTPSVASGGGEISARHAGGTNR